jgi:hypothetical protein
MPTLGVGMARNPSLCVGLLLMDYLLPPEKGSVVHAIVPYRPAASAAKAATCSLPLLATSPCGCQAPGSP